MGRPKKTPKVPPLSVPQVTVMTLRYDEFYPLEYVNRLYRGVKRNLTIPFEFVAYVNRTDGLDEGIKCLPLPEPDLIGCALTCCRENPPGVNTGTIFALGLDCVIVGSLDDLITTPGYYVVMKDYPPFACPGGRERDGNTEVQLIKNGAARRIWQAYEDKVPMRMHGMTIINDPKYCVRFDMWPWNWIISYKLGVKDRGLPEDCRIVSFHGVPKPADCMNEEFVREHWI